MNIKIKFLSLASIQYLALILSASNLFALSVDLRTFDPFPSNDDAPGVVVISPDGSSATLYEDWFYAPVSLEKDDFYIPMEVHSPVRY